MESGRFIVGMELCSGKLIVGMTGADCVCLLKRADGLASSRSMDALDLLEGGSTLLVAGLGVLETWTAAGISFATGLEVTLCLWTLL